MPTHKKREKGRASQKKTKLILSRKDNGHPMKLGFRVQYKKKNSDYYISTQMQGPGGAQWMLPSSLYMHHVADPARV